MKIEEILDFETILVIISELIFNDLVYAFDIFSKIEIEAYDSKGQFRQFLNKRQGEPYGY